MGKTVVQKRNGIFMKIIIDYTANIYDTIKGKQRLVKKNVKFREQIETDDIISVKHHHDKKGELVNDKSLIHHRQYGLMVIDKPFDELTRIVDGGDRQVVRGFQIEKNEKRKSSKKRV